MGSMLQLPPAPTTVVPSTITPLAANRVMVSPAVPVPLMAGLGLLVRLSPSTPLSLGALAVKAAVATAGAMVSKVTLNATGALVLPAGSVALTLRVLRPSLR